ncbi:MAG TPA: NAD(P)/FAD-dependent oxidoreductase [Thermoanaerobaculia bacterium]|jgi:kynurenine 3-monooxygenase|nr:NAD(P)/FAD-dependent oxidoreductase [Thermoanaerobaculia bacterium]
MDHVAVIGGGLAGSLFALRLARQGHRVDVYERRPDPRLRRGEGGRSINLGLSKRGIAALGEVGLREEVLSLAVPMEGRVIHTLDGVERFQPYGKNRQEVLHSIDRNELNDLLLDRAEAHSQVRLHFEHRCVGVDAAARTILVADASGAVRPVSADWAVGADGAFSKIREEMQRGQRANFSKEFLEWGYKELNLPARADGTSQLRLNALHVWPRGHCLIVSHANRNGSHTLTLFLPFEGADSFATLRTPSDISSFFARYFPDLVPLLPELLSQWESHPVGSLVTTRTTPWHLADWIVLVGDACHAVYPFYGQGMNSAFEDCSALAAALAAHPARLDAFRAYERSRRPHTDTLAELSKENFVELRQRVQSPLFVLRKRMDVWLNRLAPSTWLPLYTMIAHTTMPYGDALARARRQDRLLLSLAGACGVAVLGALALLLG